MKFTFKEHTDKGAVRQANEDSLGVELNTINGSVFVVCDGMGGHVGGAMASSIAVKSIMDYFKLELHENPFIALDNAFQFANTQIFAKTLEDPSLKGMGTTGVILLVRDEDIYIGHVGDSRIYIKSRGQLSRITKDHSYVQQLVDQGIILDEEAESHPQKNQILKALGHSEEVKPTICQQPIKAKKGDLFLLCSDGQCGMVVDRDMEELIDGENIEASVENLYNVAMEHGGTDNITNILIKITESTNPTSSFKDVGPKRNKPRNPDFETTNAMQGGNIVEEDYPVEKPKRKMLWIGLAASVVIGVAVYFTFFNNDEPVIGGGPGNGGSSDNDLTITSAEIKEKNKEEMDVFVAQINNKEKKYVCEDCDGEYAKDNVKYIFTLEHHLITKVEEKKSGSPEPEKPGPVKTDPVKPQTGKTEPVKTEPVKPQTGKTSVTFVIKSGDAYSKLQQAADAKCGKGKITIDDWSPKITEPKEMKPGTYTCDCPK
jgi:serine/threonine protein phosphatase PrpC